ncbi:filamentous hemagglutinin family protein [Variovorax sp. ZT5P49]|uniref:filamentous haemagglutinin family protein n=1 Tax=Variovorax sp. ZT5P49 TaxID=3443733 RepID=UPI003F47C6F6
MSTRGCIGNDRSGHTKNILAWSAEGDINAGRGSKTSVAYTPSKRVYDAWGNVRLSSDVLGTGAGIATLAPIPENFVQIAAHGDQFDPAVMSKLSEAEQRELRKA